MADLHDKATSRVKGAVMCGIILAAALFSNVPLIRGQFHGDDEAMQAWTCSRMIGSLSDWQGTRSLAQVARLFAQENHPPMRYLLSLPGMLLLPGHEFGLRMIAILLSLYMTYQVILLGNDLGGGKPAYASGLLVACSAAYNWTSMAFAWSLTAAMLIIAIRALRTASLDISDPREVRTLRKVNFCVAIAFLVNTGNIIFFAATILVYLANKRRRPLLLLAQLRPFLIFYALYYVCFLVLAPALLGNAAGGQLLQNISRAHAAHINVTSLVENVKGLNAHYFPYLGPALVACSVYFLVTRERRIALWVIPFVMAWSFLFTKNTQQYMVLISVCLLPFGVKLICSKVSGRSFAFAAIATAVLFISWNYVMFIRTYGDADYPRRLMRWGYASRVYCHNIVEPYREIGVTLDSVLGPGDRFVENLGGSFTIYYYKDGPAEYRHTKWAGRLESAEYPVLYDSENDCHVLAPAPPRDVRAAVTKLRLCPSQVEETICYPDSTTKLYVLKRR